MNSSVPLLTQSSDYREWKVKIIIFMKRQNILWVSYGFGRKYFDSENDQLNAKNVAFEIMKLALSPSLRWILERNFGMIDEDHNITLERTSSTISILDPKISASTLSDEVVQDKEETEEDI